MFIGESFYIQARLSLFFTFLFFHICLERYSRGLRGSPAKGVGRETGARVRIPPAPPRVEKYNLLSDVQCRQERTRQNGGHMPEQVTRYITHLEGSHSQVECTGLENRRPRKGSVGSNPTPSANLSFDLGWSQQNETHWTGTKVTNGTCPVGSVVEQLTSNEQAVGSNPTRGSISVLIGVMPLC